MSSYPDYRPRRLRRTSGLRRAWAETALTPADLVAPLFVKEGIGEAVPISSMPGQSQHTLESLLKEARELASRGVAGILLFGVPERKDAGGSESFNDDGIVQRGLRALKDELGDDFVVFADLCLCEYTDHGHCGLIDGDVIDNDTTLATYARIGLSQARAGADVVAPSGMMDGQVGAIRSALDDAGFTDTAILSYAVKYASSLYGPFREAGEGAPKSAYNVSGEYSMLLAAAERGWIDERAATIELLTSIKRAGADLIMTYHAKKAAEWLQ
jgi:porphobilinogen synthase